MLTRLSGRWHEVLSGLCVLNCETEHINSGCSRTRVRFRSLSQSDVDWYLKTGEYRDKAGAYAVQGYASLFIERIDGCYFNVVGFPVTLFEKLCKKSGINLKDHLFRNSSIDIRQSSIELAPAEFFAQQIKKRIPERKDQAQR